MNRTENGLIYLGKEDVFKFLKNRPPLLMIDDVYVEPGKSAFSEKKLYGDEWFFKCHFPGNPVMPGVLQLESIFNTAAMPIKLMDGYQDKTTNVASIDYVKYKKHILPNETIRIKTEIFKFRRGIAKARGIIETEGVLCCESEFTLVVLDDVIQVEN